MPLSTKLIADYVELFNNSLDGFLFSEIQEFKDLRLLLEDVVLEKKTVDTEKYSAYLFALRSFLCEPDSYVQDVDNYQEFRDLLISRIESKIKELREMTDAQKLKVLEDKKQHHELVQKNQKFMASKAPPTPGDDSHCISEDEWHQQMQEQENQQAFRLPISLRRPQAYNPTGLHTINTSTSQPPSRPPSQPLLTQTDRVDRSQERLDALRNDELGFQILQHFNRNLFWVELQYNVTGLIEQLRMFMRSHNIVPVLVLLPGYVIRDIEHYLLTEESINESSLVSVPRSRLLGIIRAEVIPQMVSRYNFVGSEFHVQQSAQEQTERQRELNDIPNQGYQQNRQAINRFFSGDSNYTSNNTPEEFETPESISRFQEARRQLMLTRLTLSGRSSGINQHHIPSSERLLYQQRQAELDSIRSGGILSTRQAILQRFFLATTQRTPNNSMAENGIPSAPPPPAW